ncbi:efflux RND transporter periplasmic adaptor subunit [Rhizosaccharibacter radicis]|uniref:Efflux RND transporter periplasmic adaptor subunit n=1 Tax=Rhizosaccharibacter radicis TaxID=2782605 RepID=A0ABT1VZD8_9PROT|nr:efflux RND transporter periplasmic adaptor subunit [Acetobacteraceae bacterium KSS12]
MRPAASLSIALLPIVALLATAGCDDHKNQQQAAPPPPEVSVLTIQPRAVTLETDLPGRASAFRISQVRPQVGGVILRRLFTEGDDVREGQQLYQIDPAPFRASLDSARAAVARAQAGVVSNGLIVKRYGPLAQAQAVSKQDLSNAQASLQQSQADVQSGRAQVETAEINLAYTKVLSPISGRTGRSAYTEGALVTQNQTDSLVTVTQLDPIYVDVTQPVSTLLRFRRELNSGQIKPAGDGSAQVKLLLEDGTPFDQTGKLQFSEVNVDQTTGSVTLRAIFPNPQRLLLPGMFVREKIEEGVQPGAFLVPQRAVGHTPKGEATVLLVGPDNKVQSRTIRTDRAIGNDWLVSGGLKAGDKVIVAGQMKAHPGTVVRPSEVKPDELTPGGSAGGDG